MTKHIDVQSKAILRQNQRVALMAKAHGGVIQCDETSVKPLRLSYMAESSESSG